MTPFPMVPSGGTFAFLFSDIEGSTVRWERRPEAMRQALALHDRVMRQAMDAHGGHVFKTMGDAFCVAFADAGAAVAAAVAAQRGLAAEDFTSVDGLAVRVGVHAGSAERRDDDYFGPALNRVARLMSAAHGGQILVSGAVAGLLQGVLPDGGALRNLGQHRLKDLIQPEQVFQVDAEGLADQFPPLRSLGSIPNNLPQQPTSFIGRQAELEEVASLLERYRLVTLAGSGGLGKTRLSLQIGAELLERYPDGVWFVELAPLSEEALVAETVADLFGLTGQRGRSTSDMVTGFLRHKKLLLILDNCEHLIQAVATLADLLVRHCSHVSLLASSREPLQIAGEYLFRMPMLAVPAETAGLTAAAASGYPAVELFVERARASLGQYTLIDADAPSVAAICRRLDGIALAIELAAPRLKMLKPAQLLQRLDDRFRLLTGGSRAALPRQQTLRALVDWSHNLLSEPEQVLMRRLAVFADGWTLDAATAVTAGEPLEDWEIFDLLASLVDKSLVVADQSGTDTRYRFLETTRHYAREKLKEVGETGHYKILANYLADLTNKAYIEYQTTPTPTWLLVYAPELDNIRAALDWSFEPAGDPAIGLALTAYSFGLFGALNHFIERKRRIRLAVARLTDSTPPEIASRIYYASGQSLSVGIVSGREATRRAVELGRLSGDPGPLCMTLLEYAASLMTEATLEESAALVSEALTIARSLGRTKRLTHALLSAGLVEGMRGDFDAQRAFWQEGLIVARAIEDTAGEALFFTNMAWFAAVAGDMDTAIAGTREAITAARAASFRGAEMAATENLACFLTIEGRSAEALPAATKALRMAQELGYTARAAIAITYVAAAIEHVGAATAAMLQGFSDATLAAEQMAYEPLDRRIVERTMEALAAALPETERESLMSEGSAMTLDAAAALALKCSAI